MQDKMSTKQGRGRYTLLLAMLIVRQLETMPSRKAVFDEIKAKNRVIRWVAKGYALGGALIVRRVLLCLYMLKCVVLLPARPSVDADGLAIATFANEVATIKRITALMPDKDVVLLSPTVRNAVRPWNLMAGLRFLGTVPALWRILGVLARRYDFMPACRISSVLAFYISFGRFLDRGLDNAFVVVASNYSPEGLALAAAGHHRRRRVVYVNHAPVPANSAFVPPVLADVAAFYGKVVHDTYRQRSRCFAAPIYIGQPGAAAAMQFVDAPQTIGIFLTALTRKETIARLISQARAIDPTHRFLIRHHPVSLIETDLTDITAGDSKIRVTSGTPLNVDIAACDVVLCGNSGVTLNVLRGGRPVGYVSDLDAIAYDYNGFVQTGVVTPVLEWNGQSYDALRDFYSGPQWQAIMSRYDASYGRDQSQVDAAARAALLSALQG